MKRRAFIGLVGGAVTAWPLAARAQPAGKPHRMAFVHSGIPADQLTETKGPFWVRRFYETLRGLGPIAAGLVTSLAHPGGNLTGVSVDAGVEIVARRLQILKEAIPLASKVAYLDSTNLSWDSGAGLADRDAAQHLGIALTGNFSSRSE